MNISVWVLVFANIIIARVLSVWYSEKQRYITIKNEKIAKIFVDSQMFLSRRKNKYRNRMRIMGLVSYISVAVGVFLAFLLWAVEIHTYKEPLALEFLIWGFILFSSDIKELKRDKVIYVITIVALIIIALAIMAVLFFWLEDLTNYFSKTINFTLP